MKFKYVFFALALFLLAGVFVYYNKRDLGIRSGSQIYTFTKLEATQAAQVRFQGASLSKASPFVVLFEGILDAHYSTLVQKKEDLFLASALEQFTLQTQSAISVGQEPPKRAVNEICNQYGFRCPDGSHLRFEGPQNFFLKVDGKIITREQVKLDSVILKAAQSEVLDYLITRINEKIRSRLLYLLSKDKNQSVQEYVDQNIIRDEEVRVWSQKASLSASSVPDEQKSYAQFLYQQHKDRVVTDFLLKNYIQKPIVVNIQKPQFNFETRWEWTPFFGIAPRKNSIHVVLFYDFFSQASRSTLKMLLTFREKKMDFTVGLRPAFSANDRMQGFLTEYLFCSWLKNPEDYWKLLELFSGLSASFTEDEVNTIAAKAGMNISAIKKCTIARETKDIVDYHLKTAQYLRLNSLPTIFIGNEVRVGPLDIIEFERILNRQ